MSFRSISLFTWQVLRAAKRSKTPPTGRTLRVTPTRQSKDGSFLNALVDEGLLTRVSGSAEDPFEATYTLTERGEHAAEYGEYEIPPKHRLMGLEPPTAQKKPKKG